MFGPLRWRVALCTRPICAAHKDATSVLRARTGSNAPVDIAPECTILINSRSGTRVAGIFGIARQNRASSSPIRPHLADIAAGKLLPGLAQDRGVVCSATQSPKSNLPCLMGPVFLPGLAQDRGINVSGKNTPLVLRKTGVIFSRVSQQPFRGAGLAQDRGVEFPREKLIPRSCARPGGTCSGDSLHRFRAPGLAHDRG